MVGTECEEDRDFYSPSRIDDCLQYMPEGFTFDPIAMTADVDARTVQPLVDAQKLFTTFPYMTRMFTTISPDEMSKDPMFSFNPDLPDVSHIHTITGVAQCKSDSSHIAEKVTLLFPDGDSKVIEGEFSTFNGVGDGATDGGDAMVAVAEIQVLNESGPPEIVAASDIHTTEAKLDMRSATPGQAGVEQEPGGTTGVDGLMGTPGSTTGGSGSSSGCTTTGGSTPALPFVLRMAAALLLVRIRRTAI